MTDKEPENYDIIYLMGIIETSVNEIKDLLNISSAYFLPSKKDGVFNVFNFLKKIEKESNLKLFAFKINKLPIGYISVILSDNSCEIEIGPMFILPKYTGKGYGKQQVEFVINWAKDNDYKTIKTRTWGQNVGSRKIFESLCFKKIVEKLKHRINGDSTVCYELVL